MGFEEGPRNWGQDPESAAKHVIADNRAVRTMLLLRISVWKVRNMFGRINPGPDGTKLSTVALIPVVVELGSPPRLSL